MSFQKHPSAAAVWFDIYSNVLLQLLAEYGAEADISAINAIALRMADNAAEAYKRRFAEKAKA